MAAPFGAHQGDFFGDVSRDPTDDAVRTSRRLDDADGDVAPTLAEGYGAGGGPATPPIGLMSGSAWMVLLTVSYPSSVKVTVYAP
jgi:hypothetical protein